MWACSCDGVFKRISIFILSVLSCCVYAEAFLPAKQAFDFTWQQNKQAINLNWRIQAGYFLYREKIKANNLSNKHNIQIHVPAGRQIADPIFGQVSILEDQLTINIPLNAMPNNTDAIEVHYQGCALAGLCYPPSKEVIQLKIKQ